jgi:hypothetical protein
VQIEHGQNHVLLLAVTVAIDENGAVRSLIGKFVVVASIETPVAPRLILTPLLQRDGIRALSNE